MIVDNLLALEHHISQSIRRIYHTETTMRNDNNHILENELFRGDLRKRMSKRAKKDIKAILNDRYEEYFEQNRMIRVVSDEELESIISKFNLGENEYEKARRMFSMKNQINLQLKSFLQFLLKVSTSKNDNFQSTKLDATLLNDIHLLKLINNVFKNELLLAKKNLENDYDSSIIKCYQLENDMSGDNSSDQTSCTSLACNEHLNPDQNSNMSEPPRFYIDDSYNNSKIMEKKSRTYKVNTPTSKTFSIDKTNNDKVATRNPRTYSIDKTKNCKVNTPSRTYSIDKTKNDKVKNVETDYEKCRIYDQKSFNEYGDNTREILEHKGGIALLADREILIRKGKGGGLSASREAIKKLSKRGWEETAIRKITTFDGGWKETAIKKNTTMNAEKTSEPKVEGVQIKIDQQYSKARNEATIIRLHPRVQPRRSYNLPTVNSSACENTISHPTPVPPRKKNNRIKSFFGKFSNQMTKLVPNLPHSLRKRNMISAVSSDCSKAGCTPREHASAQSLSTSNTAETAKQTKNRISTSKRNHALSPPREPASATALKNRSARAPANSILAGTAKQPRMTSMEKCVKWLESEESRKSQPPLK